MLIAKIGFGGSCHWCTEAIFEEATLEIPKTSWWQSGGKEGRHTEHLGFLLAEMQYLQRTFPNSTW